MVNDTQWYWSCKLKRPDTLKRHKTFETAAKRAGDYGFVYSEDDKTVKQIFHMSNNTIKGIVNRPEFPRHKIALQCSVLRGTNDDKTVSRRI